MQALLSHFLFSLWTKHQTCTPWHTFPTGIPQDRNISSTAQASKQGKKHLPIISLSQASFPKPVGAFPSRYVIILSLSQPANSCCTSGKPNWYLDTIEHLFTQLFAHRCARRFSSLVTCVRNLSHLSDPKPLYSGEKHITCNCPRKNYKKWIEWNTDLYCILPQTP